MPPEPSPTHAGFGSLIADIDNTLLDLMNSAPTPPPRSPVFEPTDACGADFRLCPKPNSTLFVAQATEPAWQSSEDTASLGYRHFVGPEPVHLQGEMKSANFSRPRPIGASAPPMSDCSPSSPSKSWHWSLVAGSEQQEIPKSDGGRRSSFVPKPLNLVTLASQRSTQVTPGNSVPASARASRAQVQRGSIGYRFSTLSTTPRQLPTPVDTGAPVTIGLGLDLGESSSHAPCDYEFKTVAPLSLRRDQEKLQPKMQEPAVSRAELYRRRREGIKLVARDECVTTLTLLPLPPKSDHASPTMPTKSLGFVQGRVAGPYSFVRNPSPNWPESPYSEPAFTPLQSARSCSTGATSLEAIPEVSIGTSMVKYDDKRRSPTPVEPASPTLVSPMVQPASYPAPIAPARASKGEDQSRSSSRAGSSKCVHPASMRCLAGCDPIANPPSPLLIDVTPAPMVAEPKFRTKLSSILKLPKSRTSNPSSSMDELQKGAPRSLSGSNRLVPNMGSSYDEAMHRKIKMSDDARASKASWATKFKRATRSLMNFGRAHDPSRSIEEPQATSLDSNFDGISVAAKRAGWIGPRSLAAVTAAKSQEPSVAVSTMAEPLSPNVPSSPDVDDDTTAGYDATSLPATTAVAGSPEPPVTGLTMVEPASLSVQCTLDVDEGRTSRRDATSTRGEHTVIGSLAPTESVLVGLATTQSWLVARSAALRRHTRRPSSLDPFYYDFEDDSAFSEVEEEVIRFDSGLAEMVRRASCSSNWSSPSAVDSPESEGGRTLDEEGA
ncbi:hypothetical protein CBOM_03767 [Ceraceosorus bombacis]|uniref:Uncharacterized protein n=1 Tax=Ceraceosorus bombacis TaxID=401625 RepID=A0A0P1BH25_9BASI|nr:hypothetical protein CBOM_03767 [Ceraceosorus bombacis]